MQGGNPSTGSLFIVNPFRGSFFTELLSTHPRTEKRVARLKGHVL
jgi:Zn-dependent protease with chaperone function